MIVNLQIVGGQDAHPTRNFIWCKSDMLPQQELFSSPYLANHDQEVLSDG